MIKAGGLIKNSFIDYPGKIACIVFTQGCNFQCPYCHNKWLISNKLKKENLTLSEKFVLNFLSLRTTLLDGVVISGGEPTIQKNLISFCKKIKNMGYQIKLDTNGSRPDVVEKLIEKELIDYVALDIKTDSSNYAFLTKFKHSASQVSLTADIIKRSGIDYELRTTCIRSFINKETLNNMKYIIGEAELYILQQFKNNNVLNPELFGDEKEIYTDNEILELQKIAQQYVKKCTVR